MRTLLLAFALAIVCSPAHSALVDRDWFTEDTAQGIDWLDLSVTAGSATAAVALSNNSGWRLASNAEIESLFARSFDGYYDTSARTHTSRSANGYADHNIDALRWVELFGYTDIFGGDPNVSFGLYYDEDNIYRLMGVGLGGSLASCSSCTPSSTIFSTEYNESVVSAPEYSGVFLVRSSVVPVPAALWLFGSALAALAARRRFKSH